MSYYQEGYDKGYADGLAGEPARTGGLGGLFDFLLAGLTDEDTQEYESGYDDGHAVGAQERRENGGEDE